MKIGIHQPETLPWVGYFNKIMNSDMFVILDNVQFKKNNYQNRNRILSHGSINWFTVPVSLKDRLSSTIIDTEISYNMDWQTRNIKQLEGAYSKCPYYNEFMPAIIDRVRYSDSYIIDFNMEIIEYIMDYLGISNNLVYASDLSVDSHKSDLVLDICKHLEATTYLSGAGGRDYLDGDKFKSQGIEVLYQSFDTTISYTQRSEEFVPYMSIIDLLVNNSKEEAIKYMNQAFKFEK